MGAALVLIRFNISEIVNKYQGKVSLYILFLYYLTIMLYNKCYAFEIEIICTLHPHSDILLTTHYFLFSLPN